MTSKKFWYPPDTNSPDPKDSLSQIIKELEIQKIIYTYSYKKVRQCYQKKRAHWQDLSKVQWDHESLVKRPVVEKDLKLQVLTLTHGVLEAIDISLRDKTPRNLGFTELIKSITALSSSWKNNLDAVETWRKVC